MSSFACALIFTILLIFFGNGDSISYIIAQRFGILEYLSVFVIMVQSLTTMSLVSTASKPCLSFTDLEEKGLMMCYLGPLIATSIIIFPLIVTLPLEELKLHDNVRIDNQQMQLLVGDKVKIFLHTNKEWLAYLTHYLVISAGYLTMAIGWQLIQTKINSENFKFYYFLWSASVTLVGLFILLGIIVGINDKYKIHQLQEKHKHRIDAFSVTVEYMGLSSMLLCISLTMSSIINVI